jgi:transposase
MHYEIHETSVNLEIFYNFFDNLIKKNNNQTKIFFPTCYLRWRCGATRQSRYGNLKGYYFMLDNVRFHHCKKTLKLITDTNNNYIFTPPYSPNNNPIEVIFSIFKNKFKKIKKDKLKIKPLIIILINKIIESEKNKSMKKYSKDQ